MILSSMTRWTGAIVLGLTTATATLPAQATTAAATPQPQPPRAAPRAPMRIMSLTSPAFADGGVIPQRHAQAGRDVSPPLTWSGGPDSTRSFVLVVHNADVALGDGTDDLLQWLVWNIPATATSLPEGVPALPQDPRGMRQISASGPYYRGPAAPASGPAHHYLFELYALDITLSIPPAAMSPAATREAVMRAMAGHIRGKGVLVGLYRRPAP